jgi:hypothetical protein
VKRTLSAITLGMLLATLATPSVTLAQGPTLVPLKLQIVVSRNMGEKKISSLPYTLWVTANHKGATSLRMGVEVPIVQTVFGGAKDDASIARSSYSYRNVGTNIDCHATTAPEGAFSVGITLVDTAIQFDGKEGTRASGTMPGVPSFRNFTSNFNILLKDGQTAQYTAATDPVTGEVLKVDVTLTVLK